ncbi:MAG: cbb3-type cytochrome oxidase assembly protein CcoS [Lysobacteraceae bacterium]
MSILLVLVPISLVLLGLAILAFIWAVRSGQFDDLDTPSIDLLADDRDPETRPESSGGPHEDRDDGSR